MRKSKLDLIETISDRINTALVEKEKVDFWEELTLSDQSEIKQGIEELNKGKRVSYESFLKKIS
jgi:uncharacterized membrane protein